MENHTSKRKCSICEKTGIKLWREYSSFQDHLSPTCFKCTIFEYPNFDIQKSREKFLEEKSDQLGDKLPYVTTDNGEYVYSYFSIPENSYNFWKNLPID